MLLTDRINRPVDPFLHFGTLIKINLKTFKFCRYIWGVTETICLRRAVSLERATQSHQLPRYVLSSPGNQGNRGALRDKKGGEARSQRHDLHLVCGWADRTFRKHAEIREATPSARNPLRNTLQSNTYLVHRIFYPRLI